MDNQRRRLLAAIEAAFHGVELGDGVSLHETVVLDNYGGFEARLTARESDEKRDWRRLIEDPELTHISVVGGLSFYDAAGLRFHLPAYLSLAVIDFHRQDAGNVLADLMFHLTHLRDYNLGRFSVLDLAQRQCVRDVLLFLRDEYELKSRKLDKAIAGYWASGKGHSKETEQTAADVTIEVKPRLGDDGTV